MPSWGLTFFLVCFSSGLFAQSNFKCQVKDSISGETIPGATVILDSRLKGTSADKNGNAVLKGIADGKHIVRVSSLGYNERVLALTFPLADTIRPVIILLGASGEELEELVVSSTRTNSRIDDLPLKVEVMGQEDMDEESTLMPGNVSGILGDLSIITVQRTSPVNGNDAIRMQGLDARYTQIMRDGLPLYGGFSGSLGVLSVPPLDLKQVEIIKGSASTLYGGGAIGGLINFISKTPVDSAQAVVAMNVTSQKEANLNSFFSGPKKKVSYTLFAGANAKSAYDVNKDGFTDVPQNRNLSLHPRIFIYTGKKSELNIGLTSVYDERAGGDMTAVTRQPDPFHPYYEKERSFRNTLDLFYTTPSGKTGTLTLKAAGSMYQRAADYSGFIFDGRQYSTYSELSRVSRFKKHTLVTGINYFGESFRKNAGSMVLFSDYVHSTAGVFVQDDWQLVEKVSLQAGMRYDYQTQFGNFYLPRLSLFYKPGDRLSMRLGVGTGYKIPSLFDYATLSRNLVDFSPNVKPERSYGVNADINYRWLWFGKLLVQLNQALYYTNLNTPVVLDYDLIGRQSLFNSTYVVNSYGTDTYLRFKYEEMELYFGYNHTEALQQEAGSSLNVPFNPRDKYSSTFVYEVEKKWRMGVEASYTGSQYIYNNQHVHDFLFMAVMVEKKFRHLSLVLNCENLLDQRQSKFEQVVEGTRTSPVFKPLWGPVEGRAINLSVKFSF